MAKKAVVKGRAKAPVKTRISTEPAEREMMPDREEEFRQALFAITKHWVSDLQFFDDELAFFRNLIDKYFLWLIGEKNIEDTRLVTTALVKLENQRLILEQNVSQHLHHLANLLENPFPHDAQECKVEHAALENSMAAFMKDFRNIKKEVFKVSEHAIVSEKARHLLGRS